MSWFIRDQLDRIVTNHGLHVSIGVGDERAESIARDGVARKRGDLAVVFDPNPTVGCRAHGSFRRRSRSRTQLEDITGFDLGDRHRRAIVQVIVMSDPVAHVGLERSRVSSTNRAIPGGPKTLSCEAPGTSPSGS